MNYNRLLNSKVVAIIAFLVVVVCLVIAVVNKAGWEILMWFFFAFMCQFCHVASFYIGKMVPASGVTLRKIAGVFGTLSMFWLIGLLIYLKVKG